MRARACAHGTHAHARLLSARAAHAAAHKAATERMSAWHGRGKSAASASESKSIHKTGEWMSTRSHS
eukprot:6194523-Pleurochrysis_carterae.AAC.1